MAMTWIAEDVPWYLVDKSPRSRELQLGMTDEDYSMSAVRNLGEFADRRSAQIALSAELGQISTHRLIVDRDERWTYESAAHAVLAGVDGIRIHGRYYQIRQVRP